MLNLISSLFIEFSSSNNIINGKLSGVLMLPNILQLAGAILTLYFGLGATIIKRNNLKKQLFNQMLPKKDEQEEVGELFKIVLELRETSKEKNYILVGIFLIFIGYVTATVGFDIKLFNLYSYSLRVALIISIFIIVKGFRVKQKLSSYFWRIVRLLCLGSLTYLCFFVPLSKNIKIVFAFVGSTAFLILIAAFFIEKLFVKETNWDFKQQLYQANNKTLNDLGQLFDKFDEVLSDDQERTKKVLNQKKESHIKSELIKPIWDLLKLEYQEGLPLISNIEVVDILEDTQYEDGKYFVKVKFYINNELVEMVFCNILNTEWKLVEKKNISE
jgi:hypothetical protein